MRPGRFKVAAGLHEWNDEFSSYYRRDGLIVKLNHDLMSATRIDVMQVRSAKPNCGQRQQVHHQRRWSPRQPHTRVI